MSDIYKIGIKFEGFNFVRFAFEQQHDINESEDFSFEIATNIDFDKSVLIVRVFVIVSRKSVGKSVAHAETASFFHLEGADQIVEKGDFMKYPDGLLVTAISLAISTTRGAILAKGAGSFLEDIPLPIVDPKSFLPKYDDKLKPALEQNDI